VILNETCTLIGTTGRRLDSFAVTPGSARSAADEVTKIAVSGLDVIAATSGTQELFGLSAAAPRRQMVPSDEELDAVGQQAVLDAIAVINLSRSDDGIGYIDDFSTM
jgi:hypothetical protein